MKKDQLTMGLFGRLGSVMTKFFSIRSSVVARSRPFLFSFLLYFAIKTFRPLIILIITLRVVLYNCFIIEASKVKVVGILGQIIFCTCDDKCVTIIRCFHVNNSRSKKRLLFDRIYCQYLIIVLRVPITN